MKSIQETQLVLAVIAVVSAFGCGGGTSPANADAALADAGVSDASGVDAAGPCDDTEASASLRAALNAVTTDVDFTLLLRDSNGRNFSHSIGVSTANTNYESASTSKWVTAMTILRLVDTGVLSLADNPQDYIPFWTTDSQSPLSKITLAELLSFTSGLEMDAAVCTSLPNAQFATCVENIHDSNLASPIEPGTGFYYSGSHMQVAGLMAVNATGKAWSELFADFKAATSLFPSGVFDLPSEGNPRLAGGMHWKASEYLEFLDASYHNQLLSVFLKSVTVADHTAAVEIKNSPALTGLGEDWHYAYGFWLECPSASYDCTGISRISSPGAYGAYPFMDYSQRYFGILARQGALGTYPEGKAIIEAVQAEIEEWAACRP
jgi:CubicO group peptidase (beta-lactamase class C family)